MRNRIVFFLTFVVATGCFAQKSKDMLELKAKVMDVGLRSDSLGLVAVQNELEPFIKNKKFAALAHYYTAFAKWQLSFLVTDRDALLKLGNDGLAHLEKAKTLKKNFADAYALSYFCHSPLFRVYKQEQDWARIGELAPKSDAMYQKALELEPKNPRAMLANAMDLFFTPENRGGSQPKAIALYKQALAILEKQPSNESIQPDWGLAIGYGWLGQAYLNLQPAELEKAKAACEKSLAVAPELAFVKYMLLPRVEAQLKQ